MSERAVYVQRIDPERRQEYVDAHDGIPSGVTNAMQRGGVETFELYVRGDLAVCIVDAEDVGEYVDAVSDDPAVEEWERHVARFKTEGVDVDAPADDQIPFMDRIWSFRPNTEESS